jgi:hypothetical protein
VDLRTERNKLHELMSIMIVVICEVISSAHGWEAIEEFGREKHRWLRWFGPLVNGVPSHDYIAKVIPDSR